MFGAIEPEKLFFALGQALGAELPGKAYLLLDVRDGIDMIDGSSGLSRLIDASLMVEHTVNDEEASRFRGDMPRT